MQCYQKKETSLFLSNSMVLYFTAGSSQAVFEQILESETVSRYFQNLNNQFNAIFFNQPQNT